jgi:hypothetical protein
MSDNYRRIGNIRRDRNSSFDENSNQQSGSTEDDKNSKAGSSLGRTTYFISILFILSVLICVVLGYSHFKRGQHLLVEPNTEILRLSVPVPVNKEITYRVVPGAEPLPHVFPTKKANVNILKETGKSNGAPVKPAGTAMAKSNFKIMPDNSHTRPSAKPPSKPPSLPPSKPPAGSSFHHKLYKQHEEVSPEVKFMQEQQLSQMVKILIPAASTNNITGDNVKPSKVENGPEKSNKKNIISSTDSISSNGHAGKSNNQQQPTIESKSVGAAAQKAERTGLLPQTTTEIDWEGCLYELPSPVAPSSAKLQQTREVEEGGAPDTKTNGSPNKKKKASQEEPYGYDYNRRHIVPPPAGPVTLVCCSTTKGPLNIEVHPSWAPHGAERFLHMVSELVSE